MAVGRRSTLRLNGVGMRTALTILQVLDGTVPSTWSLECFTCPIGIVQVPATANLAGSQP